MRSSSHFTLLLALHTLQYQTRSPPRLSLGGVNIGRRAVHCQHSKIPYTGVLTSNVPASPGSPRVDFTNVSAPVTHRASLHSIARSAKQNHQHRNSKHHDEVYPVCTRSHIAVCFRFCHSGSRNGASDRTSIGVASHAHGRAAVFSFPEALRYA